MSTVSRLFRNIDIFLIASNQWRNDGYFIVVHFPCPNRSMYSRFVYKHLVIFRNLLLHIYIHIFIYIYMYIVSVFFQNRKQYLWLEHFASANGGGCCSYNNNNNEYTLYVFFLITLWIYYRCLTWFCYCLEITGIFLEYYYYYSNIIHIYGMESINYCSSGKFGPFYKTASIVSIWSIVCAVIRERE